LFQGYLNRRWAGTQIFAEMSGFLWLFLEIQALLLFHDNC